jgi:hypothetical protein
MIIAEENVWSAIPAKGKDAGGGSKALEGEPIRKLI